jgi:transposase-like protein
MKREVAADIRAIFNAATRYDAETLLAKAVQKYSPKAAALAQWMENNIPEGLTVFAFPSNHQRQLRTTNSLERLNREIRRRTRVAMLFPNEASCLRLVSAIVMEISDDWQTGRTHIRLDNL